MNLKDWKAHRAETPYHYITGCPQCEARERRVFWENIVMWVVFVVAVYVITAVWGWTALCLVWLSLALGFKAGKEYAGGGR